MFARRKSYVRVLELGFAHLLDIHIGISQEKGELSRWFPFGFPLKLFEKGPDSNFELPPILPFRVPFVSSQKTQGTQLEGAPQAPRLTCARRQAKRAFDPRAISGCFAWEYLEALRDSGHLLVESSTTCDNPRRKPRGSHPQKENP